MISGEPKNMDVTVVLRTVFSSCSRRKRAVHIPATPARSQRESKRHLFTNDSISKNADVLSKWFVITIARPAQKISRAQLFGRWCGSLRLRHLLYL